MQAKTTSGSGARIRRKGSTTFTSSLPFLTENQNAARMTTTKARSRITKRISRAVP